MTVISVQQRSYVSTLEAGISVGRGCGARAGSRGVQWCLGCRPHVPLFVGTKQETPPHHPYRHLHVFRICTAAQFKTSADAFLSCRSCLGHYTLMNLAWQFRG